MVLDIISAVLLALLAHHAHGKVRIRVYSLNNAHRTNLLVLVSGQALLGVWRPRAPHASKHVQVTASGAGRLETGGNEFFGFAGLIDLLLRVEETVLADGFVVFDLTG